AHDIETLSYCPVSYIVLMAVSTDRAVSCVPACNGSCARTAASESRSFRVWLWNQDVRRHPQPGPAHEREHSPARGREGRARCVAWGASIHVTRPARFMEDETGRPRPNGSGSRGPCRHPEFQTVAIRCH